MTDTSFVTAACAGYIDRIEIVEEAVAPGDNSLLVGYDRRNQSIALVWGDEKFDFHTTQLGDVIVALTRIKEFIAR